MTAIQTLGVFLTLYPDGEMPLSRTLLISVIGFLTVFVILIILALFVKTMGKIFDSINAKKKAVVVDDGVVTDNTVKAVADPVSVDLIDVTDSEAVCIMAIVSDKSGIPLNRLKFNYIKKLPEDR